MTIINYASDGLPPELISLFRGVAYSKRIELDDLVEACLPPLGSSDEAKKKKNELMTRFRGALSRWTDLGLFVNDNGTVQLADGFGLKRKETIDELTSRLPNYCRKLILKSSACEPLWGETGLTSDFARGASWLLAQDIYALPRTWSDISPLQNNQALSVDKRLSQNDVRWNGLRFWSRYLGFIEGDSKSFQVDPTVAIRNELGSVFGGEKELPAHRFLDLLALQLPVLDQGSYRLEVEESLNPAVWRKPDNDYLSMSLSFALKRLELDKDIELISKADAGKSLRLTGRNFRSWGGFESVQWMGKVE